MASRKSKETGMVVLVVSFALLAVSMGLDGPLALLLNVLAIVGFVVALVLQFLPGPDDPES